MSKLRTLFLFTLVTAVIATSAYLVYNRYIKDYLASRQPVQQSSSATASASEAAAGTSTKTGTDKKEQSGQEQQSETKNADNSGGKPEGPEGLQLMEPQTANGFELDNLSGKKIKLSDYKGKQVVLSFWTTWSPYCIDGMPELQKAGKNLEESKKAALLTINVGEDRKTVEEFAKSESLTIPVLLDSGEAVAQSYGMQSFPATIFINSDGTVYGYINQVTDTGTIMKIIDKMK